MLSPALTAAAGPSTTGALLCAVSLAASGQDALAPTALQVKLPNLPKIGLPKLPEINIDLPNFGKKGDAPSAKGNASTVPRTTASAGTVKVRAANIVVPSDAPTAPSISGIASGVKATDGWKRFPSRRMPGANMDSFKEMAKGMKIGPEMK